MGQEKFEIAPQLKTYVGFGELSWVLAPYITMAAEPSFVSPVVNTDSHGFRITHGPHGPCDSHSWFERADQAVLIGSSMVFGVGATSDRTTVASKLSELTGVAFQNLGIMGGNSMQELIASIPFVEKARTIVLCTGFNNLGLSLVSSGRNTLYGPHFFEGVFAELARHHVVSLANRVKHPIAFGVGANLVEGVVRMMRRARGRGSPDAKFKLAFQEKAVEDAVEHHRRALSIISKARRADARILFAVQPQAEQLVRETTPEEKRLFELVDSTSYWRTVRGKLRELWPPYVEALRAMCRGVGVPFVDLNEVSYTGWSFVDRVHMTDGGYANVAARLAKELGVA